MKEYENKDGYILIPQEEFAQLKRDMMMLESAVSYYRSYGGNGQKEEYPADMIYAITVENFNPIKAFRIYRGMSQAELAKQVGVSKTMISHMESGRKQGSVRTLKRMAKVLDVGMEDLI